MKTYLLTVIFFLFCMQYAAAQKENNNWCFGYHAGLSFNTVPSHVTLNNVIAQGVAAAVSDDNGNLLFYTNGGTVWDRNDNIMPNGDTIITPDWYLPLYDLVSFAEILPDPGNSNRYYIFSPAQRYSYIYAGAFFIGELTYSIVDMTLNNGLGDVVPGYKNILLDSNINLFVATAGSGYCNKWIVTAPLNSNNFHSFLVTPTGINAPVVSTAGNVTSMDNTLGVMKISPNDKRLAVNMIDGSLEQNYIQLFDFDVNTGVVSNPILVDSTNDSSSGYGIEFSPDNTKLYFLAPDSLYIINEIGIYQLDITLPTATAIHASKNRVGITHNSLDAIQLGPDGKIYFVDSFNAFTTNYLGVINNPNAPGLACNVANFVMSLAGTSQVIQGLCSRVPVKDAIFSDSVIACHFPDTISSSVSAASYVWSTGGTSQSTVIDQPGTYWVKATQPCGAWRVDTFHITRPAYNPVTDTFSCNGSVTIQGNAADYNQWSDGTTGPTFSTSKSGIYSVIATSGQCVYNDTFHVYIYPPPNTAILPADTIICNSGMAASLAPYYDLGNYQWSTGATDNAISINTPGPYWLTSVTPCGIFSDTVQVSFCKPVIDTITATLDTFCSGQCILFMAQVSNNPQIYQWSFAGGTPSSFTGATPPAVCYDSAGTYSISLSVAGAGGTTSAATQITVLPKPVSSFTDTSISVPYNSTLLLPPCSAAAHTKWYYNNELLCDSCNNYRLDATYYQAAYKCIISNGDCSDSCNYNITVTDIPTDVSLPNAFSPNGDGVNDYFHVITTNPNVKILVLSVYNRWGECLFKGVSDYARWDGNHNGVPVSIDTYFWTLEYIITGNPATFYKKGDVTVVR